MVSYLLVTMFLSMPMQNFMHRLPDLLQWAVDARGAVGIAAPWRPEPRAAHAPKRALTTGWLGSKSRLCACNSP
jgi:hypothetical protein